MSTFVNRTAHLAQFVVRRGEQVIARLSGVAPDTRPVSGPWPRQPAIRLTPDTGAVSTGEVYSIHAIIDGITTEPVTTDRLDAVVTLTGCAGEGYRLLLD
ncbi:hypothetical protein [Derxia gummosa]|uniref:Uncharacterized protein n=1 Tax=Derxia gummosa DSM 723 TaxID=1121388 RepID=A0A8B6X4H7_9BURK|nr:hypothetical protein [Derxia gummosa]